MPRPCRPARPEWIFGLGERSPLGASQERPRPQGRSTLSPGAFSPRSAGRRKCRRRREGQQPGGARPRWSGRLGARGSASRLTTCPSITLTGENWAVIAPPRHRPGRPEGRPYCRAPAGRGAIRGNLRRSAANSGGGASYKALPAAAATFCAASPRSSARISERPDSFSRRSPSSTFVPQARDDRYAGPSSGGARR